MNQGSNSGLSHSKKAIQMQAKRELERERMRAQDGQRQPEERREKSSEPQPQQDEDSTILYTCDLLEDLALPKSQVIINFE